MRRCIAGNKCDLKNRHVSEDEAAAYARSVGAEHFNTSAKLDKGVTEIFLALTKRTSGNGSHRANTCSSRVPLGGWLAPEV